MAIVPYHLFQKKATIKCYCPLIADRNVLVCYKGIFYGKIRTAYTKECKLKVTNLYEKKEIGIRSIAKERGSGFAAVQRRGPAIKEWIGYMDRLHLVGQKF